MRRLLLCAVMGCIGLHAKVDPLEGLWQGYDGEWGHVSRQLVALAEAIPASKYAWCPAPGVRSTSEVLMHIALTNFWLLSITGIPMPADIKSPDMEKGRYRQAGRDRVAEVLARCGQECPSLFKPGDLQRKVKVEGRDATVDGMYLRIIVHANEHMGQLVAYARVNALYRPGPKAARSNSSA